MVAGKDHGRGEAFVLTLVRHWHSPAFTEQIPQMLCRGLSAPDSPHPVSRPFALPCGGRSRGSFHLELIPARSRPGFIWLDRDAGQTCRGQRAHRERPI